MRWARCGPRRLCVRGVFTASCGARWLLACGYACAGSRALAMLLWFARDCQTIQYSRAKFRWEGRELKLPLVGYSAPSFPRIVDPAEMIQTNKILLPRNDLPWCCGSRISSTLCSPAALLISCDFPPLWFLAISNASLLRPRQKT